MVPTGIIKGKKKKRGVGGKENEKTNPSQFHPNKSRRRGRGGAGSAGASLLLPGPVPEELGRGQRERTAVLSPVSQWEEGGEVTFTFFVFSLTKKISM